MRPEGLTSVFRGGRAFLLFPSQMRSIEREENFRLEKVRKKKTLSREAQGRNFTIEAISEGEIEQFLVEILLEQVRRCLLVA